MVENWVLEAWNFIEEKTSANCKEIGANFPHVGCNKKYIFKEFVVVC